MANLTWKILQLFPGNVKTGYSSSLVFCERLETFMFPLTC